MVLVRMVTADDWETLRDIRLAALRDAPSAFGSTYEEQLAFTKQDWLRRIAGTRTFFAYLAPMAAAAEAPGRSNAEPEVDGRPVGLVGGYQDTRGVARLISMWVDPRARGRRVGEALIAAVVDWARTETDASTLHLWVTESNKSAIRLYERCGFTPTGERQPLPSDPAIPEIAMSLDLRLLTSTPSYSASPALPAGNPIPPSAAVNRYLGACGSTSTKCCRYAAVRAVVMPRSWKR